jgi:hypothetical protein
MIWTIHNRRSRNRGTFHAAHGAIVHTASISGNATRAAYSRSKNRAPVLASEVANAGNCRAVPSRLSPQHHQAAVTKVAESGHDAKFRVGYLPCPALLAQLPDRFRDMIQSCDMRFSEQTAVSVEG